MAGKMKGMKSKGTFGLKSVSKAVSGKGMLVSPAAPVKKM